MSATNWEDVYRVQTERIAELEREIASLRAHAERMGQANDRLIVENDALRKDYVEMGQTALRSEINHYIGSIIMTDEQRKLREAVKKELPERASWAEIYAVYEIVRDRTKEAQP